MEELCQILRKHKVKMTPNVKTKLREKYHLLDEEYTTIRINMVIKVTILYENEDGKKNNKTKTVRTLIKGRKRPDQHEGSHQVHFKADTRAGNLPT